MGTKTAIAGIFALALMQCAGSYVWGDEEPDPKALAKAMADATVTLDKGLEAAEKDGTAISGQFEIDNGKFQLSVFTMKGSSFDEVIVDHKSGAIAKSEKITDEDDVKDAKRQSQALARGKMKLLAALQSVMQANSGYKAVSIVPMLSAGEPVATITLLKGEELKKVRQKLN